MSTITRNVIDKTTIYQDYFENQGLSVANLELILTNGDFPTAKNREKSIKAFLDFLLDLNEDPFKYNLGDNYQAVDELNLIGMMYSGLIKNTENKNNSLSDNNDEIERYSGELLKHSFFSKDLNGDFLIGLISAKYNIDSDSYNNNAKKIIKDFLEQEDNEVILLAKFKKYLELTNKNDDKALHIEEVLNEKINFENFKIKEKIKDAKVSKNVDLEEYLKKVNKDSVLNKKREDFSIKDLNENIFTNEEIEIRDQLYWQRKLNEKVANHETFQYLSWKEKYTGKLKNSLLNVGFGDEYERNHYDSIFNTTVYYLDPRTGLNTTVMQIHTFSKKITVTSKPEDDQVYEMMAMAAKTKNIKKPVVNVWDRSKDVRKEFVLKTVQALLDVGYDIDSIKVPKDCREYIEIFRQPIQGISEYSENNKFDDDENEKTNSLKSTKDEEEVENKNENESDAPKNEEEDSDFSLLKGAEVDKEELKEFRKENDILKQENQENTGNSSTKTTKEDVDNIDEEVKQEEEVKQKHEEEPKNEEEILESSIKDDTTKETKIVKKAAVDIPDEVLNDKTQERNNEPSDDLNYIDPESSYIDDEFSQMMNDSIIGGNDNYIPDNVDFDLPQTNDDYSHYADIAVDMASSNVFVSKIIPLLNDLEKIKNNKVEEVENNELKDSLSKMVSSHNFTFYEEAVNEENKDDKNNKIVFKNRQDYYIKLNGMVAESIIDKINRGVKSIEATFSSNLESSPLYERKDYYSSDELKHVVSTLEQNFNIEPVINGIIEKSENVCLDDFTNNNLVSFQRKSKNVKNTR